MAKNKGLSPNMKMALAGMNPDAGETLAEMKARGLKVNPSVLRALIDRGLVESTQVEKEVVTVVKRNVGFYTLTDAGRNAAANLGDAE